MLNRCNVLYHYVPLLVISYHIRHIQEKERKEAGYLEYGLYGLVIEFINFIFMDTLDFCQQLGDDTQFVGSGPFSRIIFQSVGYFFFRQCIRV